MTSLDGDGIAPETAAFAGRVRREAGKLPGPDEIRLLGNEAERHGARGMSREEIRHLADTAVERAEQVTALLRQLSALLGEGSANEDGGRA